MKLQRWVHITLGNSYNNARIQKDLSEGVEMDNVFLSWWEIEDPIKYRYKWAILAGGQMMAQHWMLVW